MPPSDENTSDDIQAIENLLEQLEQALENADPNALMPLYCIQATAFFTSSGDLIRGRDAIISTWQRHMSKWHNVVIKRRNIVVRIHGDVAWAHFFWDGEGTTSDGHYQLTGERWTAVILWEDGAWRIAQMHMSLPYHNWEAHRR